MPTAREIRRPHRQHPADPQDHQRHVSYCLGQAAQGQAASWDQTRPYFLALKAEVKRIFRTVGPCRKPLSLPRPRARCRSTGTYGCLVITADKGLAGAYNQNVLREAQKMLSEHPDTKLFVVGEYGRQFFQRHQHSHRAQLPLYRAEPHHAARARNHGRTADAVRTRASCRKYSLSIRISKTA